MDYVKKLRKYAEIALEEREFRRYKKDFQSNGWGCYFMFLIPISAVMAGVWFLSADVFKFASVVMPLAAVCLAWHDITGRLSHLHAHNITLQEEVVRLQDLTVNMCVSQENQARAYDYVPSTEDWTQK